MLLITCSRISSKSEQKIKMSNLSDKKADFIAMFVTFYKFNNVGGLLLSVLLFYIGLKLYIPYHTSYTTHIIIKTILYLNV